MKGRRGVRLAVSAIRDPRSAQARFRKVVTALYL